MKSLKLFGITAFLTLAMHSGPGLAQLHDEEAMKAWGEGVDNEIIAGLVANRTWQIDWSACMGGANGCRTYWDFSENGTLCARGIDATRNDKCADEGSWRIEENALCWELTWLGGGEGYKSTCILIKEGTADAFETTRARGIGLPFFEFTLARND